MREFKVRSYAIRVQPHEVCQDWLDQAGENLVAVVCSNPGAPEQLTNACTRVHAISRRVLCEVTSVPQAEAALDAGSDGLIAVGHEAGGRVGADSAFILLQAILARTDRPVWIRGGIGPRVAAGCLAAGAAGVVLEGAILLARESPLGEEARMRLGVWDGSEPILIEPADGPAIRVYAPPMSPVLTRLREAASHGGEMWARAIDEEVGWGPEQAWPVGQDAALAADLAGKYVSIGGMVQTILRLWSVGSGMLRKRAPWPRIRLWPGPTAVGCRSSRVR